MASILDLLGQAPQLGGVLGALAQATPEKPDDLLGYKVREKLYPGEDAYFRKNPHVSGMASESGHIILNPFSGRDINRDAVAKNEALRLYMRDRGIVPEFDITPEQRAAFRGTDYENNDDALKQTLAARIYSGDPSAQANDVQRAWLEKLIGSFGR